MAVPFLSGLRYLQTYPIGDFKLLFHELVFMNRKIHVNGPDVQNVSHSDITKNYLEFVDRCKLALPHATPPERVSFSRPLKRLRNDRHFLITTTEYGLDSSECVFTFLSSDVAVLDLSYVVISKPY